MAPTPSWAVYGAPEEGFDPEEKRWYRNQSKNPDALAAKAAATALSNPGAVAAAAAAGAGGEAPVSTAAENHRAQDSDDA